MSYGLLCPVCGEPLRMPHICERLMQEFREHGRCQWCNRPTPGTEPHHIWGRGFGGGLRLDARENLLAVDHMCHLFLGDRSKVTIRAQLEVVAKRERRPVEEIEELLLELRRRTR